MRFSKVIFSFLVTIYVHIIPNQAEWITKLKNYIQNDLKKYQVFLIAHNDDPDSRTKQVASISKHFPTLLINFDCLEKSELKCLKEDHLYADPRQTNLNLIIPTGSGTEAIRQTLLAIDSLIPLSKGRTRPKFLIILSMTRNKSVTLLREVWNRQILDATILTVEKEKVINASKFGNVKQSATLVKYNPFLKSTKRSRLSPKSSWFPDKLLNLHQKQLKVALMTLYASATVVRNASGHVMTMFDLDANVIRFLSQNMNFSLDLIPYNFTDFGTFRADKVNQSVGLTTLLAKNELNILANSIAGQDVTDNIWSAVSRATDEVRIEVVVPIRKESVSHLIVSGRMLKTFAASGILILFLIMLAKILKLDDEVWQFFVLFRMILCIDAHKEPKKIVDQIIFASMLLTSMILSMCNYEVCTDVSINYETEIKMNTLDDLIKSGLKIKITTALKEFVLPYSEGSLRIVLENSDCLKLNAYTECLEEMAKHGNVTCIVNNRMSERALLKYKGQSDESLMKIIPEKVHNSWFYMFFERGSPYVPRFNQLILRLHENGIHLHLKDRVQRWQGNGNEEKEGKELEKMCELIRIYFCVFLVACCLSIFVFFFELLSKSE